MSTFFDVPRTRLFPCPICWQRLDVRTSKKEKPYVVCQACGMQMFVRTQPGIQKFEKQIIDVGVGNFWARLDMLESQYQKKCPKCGKTFWVNEDRRTKDWFDEFIGYSCPDSNCNGVVTREND
jgi:DNA-directed RNA polymerase subunit RPC12/RpoP